MRLATLRTGAGTSAVRIDEAGLTGLGAPDVGALLADPGWPERAAGDGPVLGFAPPDLATLATPVPRPGKVICVGLNYRTLIATGTPGGVGHARKPPRYLADGSVVVTEISGLGRLENQVQRG